MTNNQYELLKNLYTVLTDISEEAEQDESFNLGLAKIIQEKNITNISLDDISYIISQQLKENEYYADYDGIFQSYIVFGRSDKKAYSKFSIKQQAENEANRMNHIE